LENFNPATGHGPDLEPSPPTLKINFSKTHTNVMFSFHRSEVTAHYKNSPAKLHQFPISPTAATYVSYHTNSRTIPCPCHLHIFLSDLFSDTVDCKKSKGF